MKSIVRFLGAVAYALVSSFLIYLLFSWLVPWLMGFGWLALIIYCILAFGLIAATLRYVSAMITLPLLMMTAQSRLGSLLAGVVYCVAGVYTVLLPWIQGMPYRLVTVIIGVSLSLTALSIFTGAVVQIWGGYRPKVR